MTTISKIHSKLQDPEYRTAFVASQINIGIPFQLRALLKSRGKTQEWLADRADMLQPRISGLLNPGKTRPNIETLRRLAEAFDCGLAVRFVPYSELVDWSEHFDPEEFSVPCFGEDTGFEESDRLEVAAPVLAAATVPAPSHACVESIDDLGGAKIVRMPIGEIERKPMPTAEHIPVKFEHTHPGISFAFMELAS